MEKRTFTNILVTLAVLALIPIGFWLFAYLQNQHIDWSETYFTESKEPYNNYMVFNLLKSYKTEKEFVFVDNLLTEKLAEEEIKEATTPISYIFLGQYPYLLDNEIDSLMGFVEKGNTAFFAANTIPDTLFTLLDLYQGYDYAYDSLISTNFTNTALAEEENFVFNYTIRNESVAKSWNYFNDYALDNKDNTKALGFLHKETKMSKSHVYQGKNYNSDNNQEEEYTQSDEENYDGEYTEDDVMEEEIQNYTNFIRVKYGKGYFYFHKNPILFTNYYLIQENGKKYVERAFSYLPEGNILWDERSHYLKQGIPEYQKQDRGPSPLSYILSQPSLAWGYYTLLISALLFVIFRGKRMQRIIPILRKEENTSLEFTKTVGQLYYLQKDHKRLSQLKIRLFFDYVRTHYHMNTQHIDDDFRKKLSERSGIDRGLIDLLLADIQKVNGQHEVSEWLLRQIHTQIQEFYTNSK
ncbi:hypothetical protein WAF17_18870 [Bernardetia sp. ABR2-2B]|uniref:hypothetical protein n=1 Tax=Bernardetia sp. ABR2-2B TaxID=3127472 RepID=UPI0030D387F6